MFKYLINRRGVYYDILKEDKIIYHARRKTPPFTQIVTFFNCDNEVVAISKQKSFLGIWSFPYSIFFKQTNDRCFIDTRRGKLTINYRGDEYVINGQFYNKKDLYVNGNTAGRFDDLQKRGFIPLYKFSHEITCDTELSCFIFSIMDIVFDDFDPT